MHQDNFALHVGEAIEALDYIKPAYAPVLEALMPRCMVDHAYAVARAVRREGEQVSDDEKKGLGIKRNGFMSREALAMLTERGRQVPLQALENTLLRASFGCFRERHVAQLFELQRVSNKPVFAMIKGAVEGCSGCAHLDLRVPAAEAAAQFPIPGCGRDACAVKHLRHRRFPGLPRTAAHVATCRRQPPKSRRAYPDAATGKLIHIDPTNIPAAGRDGDWQQTPAR